MKIIFLIFIGILFNVFSSNNQLLGQSKYCSWQSEALVWRGFNFSWSETNHRLTSLIIKPELINQPCKQCQFPKGKCKESDGYKFLLWDEPRAGRKAKELTDYIIPADPFFLYSQATYVQSDKNFLFHNTMAVFDKVKKSHNQLYQDTITLHVPIPENSNYSNAEGFINGIMIKSIGDADKLISYTCEIISADIDKSYVTIKVGLSASFGCHNPSGEFLRKECECHISNHFIDSIKVRKFECTDAEYNYKISVPLLLVLSNHESKLVDINDNSSWETAGGKCFNKTPKEKKCATKIISEDFLKSKIQENHTDKDIANKIVGIKKMHIDLSSESHIYRWDSFFFIDSTKIKSLQLFDPSPFDESKKTKITTRNLSFSTKGSATMGLTLGIINGIVETPPTPITTKRTRACSRRSCKAFCSCDSKANLVDIPILPFKK